MTWNLEGVNAGFLRQVMGQKANRQRYKTWRSAAAVKVLKEAVTHTLGSYIDKWQATVLEWVTLRPILDIYNRDTGYEGGGGYLINGYLSSKDRKRGTR